MSVEKAVASSSVSVISEVVSNVFSGGHQSVIAILLIVVMIMGLAIYLMLKRLKEKDQLIETLFKQFGESQDKHWKELKEITDKYIKSVHDLSEDSSDNFKSISEAQSGHSILLAEIKTLLSVMFSNNRKP